MEHYEVISYSTKKQVGRNFSLHTCLPAEQMIPAKETHRSCHNYNHTVGNQHSDYHSKTNKKQYQSKKSPHLFLFHFSFLTLVYAGKSHNYNHTVGNQHSDYHSKTNKKQYQSKKSPHLFLFHFSFLTLVYAGKRFVSTILLFQKNLRILLPREQNDLQNQEPYPEPL